MPVVHHSTFPQRHRSTIPQPDSQSHISPSHTVPQLPRLDDPIHPPFIRPVCSTHPRLHRPTFHIYIHTSSIPRFHRTHPNPPPLGAAVDEFFAARELYLYDTALVHSHSERHDKDSCIFRLTSERSSSFITMAVTKVPGIYQHSLEADDLLTVRRSSYAQ